MKKVYEYIGKAIIELGNDLNKSEFVIAVDGIDWKVSIKKQK